MSNCTEGCGSTLQMKSIIASPYEAVGLGAPFKVILEGAVKVDVCIKCGTVCNTFIPDMKGLLDTVVLTRALEPRKLTGAELGFMRKAMGWKAKELAKELGMSAEHLSRCENSMKVMAPTTEKLFRLYAILKTPDKAALEELDLSAIFERINVTATWDASKPLTFRFVRRAIPTEPVLDGEEKWRKDSLKAA